MKKECNCCKTTFDFIESEVFTDKYEKESRMGRSKEICSEWVKTGKWPFQDSHLVMTFENTYKTFLITSKFVKCKACDSANELRVIEKKGIHERQEITRLG